MNHSRIVADIFEPEHSESRTQEDMSIKKYSKRKSRRGSEVCFFSHLFCPLVLDTITVFVYVGL